MFKFKYRVAWRNFVHYLRTDFKEIAWPSCLPDPPSSVPEKPLRKLSFREHLQVWKIACRLYVDSWRKGDIDFDEKPEENKTSESKTPDLSIVEELAITARTGGEKLRPALQRVYMTRASAYRDALKEFIEGYREGVSEVMAADPFRDFLDVKGTRSAQEKKD